MDRIWWATTSKRPGRFRSISWTLSMTQRKRASSDFLNVILKRFKSMSTLTKRLGLAVMVAAVSASCTVKDTNAPALAGPSELAMRIALSLQPDSILQDGFSQTALNIEVTGADGRPVRG